MAKTPTLINNAASPVDEAEVAVIVQPQLMRRKWALIQKARTLGGKLLSRVYCVAVDEWPIIQSTQGNGGVPASWRKASPTNLPPLRRHSRHCGFCHCAALLTQHLGYRGPFAAKLWSQTRVEGLISNVRLLLFFV